MENEIANLARLPHNERGGQSTQLTERILAAQPVDLTSLKTWINAVIEEETQLLIQRQCLDMICAALPSFAPDAQKDVAEFLIERISQRVSFEEQLVGLLEGLANVYEKEERWEEAAGLLARMPLESGNRSYPEQKRADVYVHIAQLFLEDGDSVRAETFINRAAGPLSKCPHDTALQLRYKVCYSRILDSKRKFIEAAQWYHRLSQTDPQQMLVAEEELMTALSHSITCAILAPAGPVRSRVLAMLYKDDRTARLGHHYKMLRNMFFHRILTAEDVELFSKTLQPHQLATLPDGGTVLDRAVAEHNLLSASKIYTNIKIDALATLLQLTPSKAESLAARMMAECRMVGKIDQVEGYLHFEPEETLQQWNEQVEQVCQRASDIVEQLIQAEQAAAM